MTLGLYLKGLRCLFSYRTNMPTPGPSTSVHIERLAGNLLKLARARTGLSQREVAQLADVAQSTIARIESSARQPSLPVLARILAALDLELRITLAPYDDHDDILDATQARLTPAQRACQESRGDDFIAALRLNAGVEPTELTDPKPR